MPLSELGPSVLSSHVTCRISQVACRSDPHLWPQRTRPSLSAGPLLRGCPRAQSLCRCVGWDGWHDPRELVLFAQVQEEVLLPGDTWLGTWPHDTVVMALLDTLCRGQATPRASVNSGVWNLGPHVSVLQAFKPKWGSGVQV